jgi:hypothetical protein
MTRQLVCLCVWTLLLTSSAFSVESSKLFKSHNQYSLEYKQYTISNECMQLVGGKRRRFLDPNWYWGEAGYGSLFGKRSGYLEGGIMGGYQHEISHQFIADYRLFIGAGGGGSFFEGNGCIVNPTMGLGIKINPQYNFFVEVGYIKFISGIEGVTFALNISMNYWELSHEIVNPYNPLP